MVKTRPSAGRSIRDDTQTKLVVPWGEAGMDRSSILRASTTDTGAWLAGKPQARRLFYAAKLFAENIWIGGWWAVALGV